MTGRIWYTAQCFGCEGAEVRVFDLKQERDAWSGNHMLTTNDDHNVKLGRTSNPPTFRPKVNCALCIQHGTQSPAAVDVGGTSVCRDHVSLMQLAWVTASTSGLAGDLIRQHALANARKIMDNTKPIGKQED